MTVSYNFQVTGVQGTDESVRKNVVKEIRLVIKASDGKHTVTNIRPVEIDPPSPSGSFTEYEDVTADMLMTWAKDKLGSEEIEAMKKGMAASLADMSDPNTDNPVKNMPLPS